MNSPIKDLRFSPKSLSLLKEIIPIDSKVDTYHLYGGNTEINLGVSGRHVLSHTTSYVIYDFWRSMFDSPETIVNAVNHFWPIEDEKLFDVYQTRFRSFSDHLVRAAMFFILNRCSSEGMIQSGILDSKNFNPLAINYIKRFKKTNFDVAWNGDIDFVDTVTQDTDADYIYIPAGRFSYNFLDDGINKGFEETRVHHANLCEKLKTFDKKVILDYVYHPRIIKMYQHFPTTILLDQYGRITSREDSAKEVILANY